MGKTTCLEANGKQASEAATATLNALFETHFLSIISAPTQPRPHEVSFLRRLQKISDECFIEINKIGTKLNYRPGIVMGGKHLVHDCVVSRFMGYFLEPLIVLSLFGKKPLSISLKEGLELKIESRGAPSHGSGEVFLSVPIVQDSLKAVSMIDKGMGKRIRGVTFSTRLHPQFENQMIIGARGILNRLLPDVYIPTDHKAGPLAGKSPDMEFH
ncbi:probable RNA 3'-terminal phosphate cyclase-like protein isoform X2 [Actinidia eriantha]|uniref:probable RNA 3'-terminal phosphate cyclase-like protein isoform X2 n=1 Tax=Actinidia eriantha TaxID=165200 RepID=UPI00258E0154|nr:probable RNA 3'-terminal phosphate cyclase-like protein isoform X2 [Actinidia eriantha]